WESNPGPVVSRFGSAVALRCTEAHSELRRRHQEPQTSPWSIASGTASLSCKSGSSANCTNVAETALTQESLASFITPNGSCYHCTNNTRLSTSGRRTGSNGSAAADYDLRQISSCSHSASLPTANSPRMSTTASDSSLLSLLVLLVITVILMYGVLMLVSVATPDRFDDPKGKNHPAGRPAQLLDIPAAREAAVCARRSAEQQAPEAKQRQREAGRASVFVASLVRPMRSPRCCRLSGAQEGTRPRKRGSTNSKSGGAASQHAARIARRSNCLKASDVFFGQLARDSRRWRSGGKARTSAKRKSAASSTSSSVLVLLLFVVQRRRHVDTHDEAVVREKRGPGAAVDDDDGEDSESQRTLANILAEAAAQALRSALGADMPFFARLVVWLARSSAASAFGSHHDQDCLPGVAEIPGGERSRRPHLQPGKHADETKPCECGTPKTRRTSGWSSSPTRSSRPRSSRRGAPPCKEAAMPLPTVQFMERKVEEIRRHINYEIKDDAELEKIIQEKRRFVSLSVNPAYRKAQLLKERGLAELEGDLEKVRQLQEQLQDVEDEQRRVEEARLKKVNAISEVNRKNRKDNLGLAEQALKEEYQEVRDLESQGGDRSPGALPGLSVRHPSSSSSPSQPASPSSPSLPLPANRHQPPPPAADASGTGADFYDIHNFDLHIEVDVPAVATPAVCRSSQGGAGDLLARSASGRSLNLDEYKRRKGLI
uniref:Ac45-VOA1_TM domain-containing protein n=1 Tax=Macrostomum lignano TaxID=282301 RepID=A0A1I8FS43_9PLAT